ncbi:MAG: hypothetical protein OES84_06015 [Kiritimatiellaceae bacterium]|nr:hypothetical protein [Kiritimatiellaceae bacterium]
MKKLVFGLVAMLMLAGAVFASRKDEVTLVMVPREDNVVRVGLDIAARYPTLLVSYKVTANGAVSFHGWTGKDWVNIKPGDFKSGGFFRKGPDSALVIEVEGATVPQKVIPPNEWCDAVYKVTTTEIRPLLHLVGQYYGFDYKEWEWFSKNYRVSMEAINPEGLNVAWYHKRFKDHLKTGSGSTGADDLQYWIAIRHPQPVEPVVEAPAETNVVEIAEKPEMELPNDPTVNPFTNSAPAAVIYGAGGAKEEIVESEKTAEEK